MVLAVWEQSSKAGAACSPCRCRPRGCAGRCGRGRGRLLFVSVLASCRWFPKQHGMVRSLPFPLSHCIGWLPITYVTACTLLHEHHRRAKIQCLKLSGAEEVCWHLPPRWKTAKGGLPPMYWWIWRLIAIHLPLHALQSGDLIPWFPPGSCLNIEHLWMNQPAWRWVQGSKHWTNHGVQASFALRVCLTETDWRSDAHSTCITLSCSRLSATHRKIIDC